MAYSIRLPDGTLVENIPDSVTPEEAKRRIIAQYPEFGPKPEGGVKGALKKGVESLVSGLVGGVKGVVDPERAAQETLEREQSIAQRYKDEVGFDKLKEAYQQQGLFAAGKELLRQAPIATVEQVPQIGLSLGSTFTGARLGAMAGAPFGPVGAGVGATVGGLAGSFAPSFLQQFGSNLSRQAAEGKTINAADAATAATAQAGLETAAGVFVLGKQMVGKLIGIPEKALDTAAGKAVADASLKRTLTTGAAKAVGVEVPTEVAQSMLERLQAGLSLTSDDAFKEYGEAAYQTILATPAFGGAARLGERSAARAQIEQQQKQDAILKRRQEAERLAKEKDLVDRQRRAQEAGVPLFAQDKRALDLAEAAVTGPPAPSAPTQVDRTQDIVELQDEYARVSRYVDNVRTAIAEASKAGDVDTVTQLSKRLTPVIQGLKQTEERLAEFGAVPDPEEAITKSQEKEAKLFKNMQKQAELGESQKAGELAEQIKTLRAERDQLKAQLPQVGGEELFMETPAGFVYPEATRRAERLAEEIDTGYLQELPPAKTTETMEERITKRQEKLREEEARLVEKQTRRDVKQLAKLMMGADTTENQAIQRLERTLESPLSLRALGLYKPEERQTYADAISRGEITPTVQKLLKVKSFDEIEAQLAKEREELKTYLAEGKQLVTPEDENRFTPDGLKAFATQVRINELEILKRNQPAKPTELLIKELLPSNKDIERIEKLEEERKIAVEQAKANKAKLNVLVAKPAANEEQLAQAQERYDTAIKDITARDTEIEQIKNKTRVGGPKVQEKIKNAQNKQDQNFDNFASSLDELRQTKLGQTERGYRYYVSAMAQEAADSGKEYTPPTFEEFKKQSTIKRKDTLEQVVAARNNYIVEVLDEIDATRKAEGVRGVTDAERNMLSKQLMKKMDELIIRGQEFDPVVVVGVKDILVEPAVMRQGKVIRSARYKTVEDTVTRRQELPRITPSKNITKERLAADIKAGVQAARPFARALAVTQEEIAEIREQALSRAARPAKRAQGEGFELTGAIPRKGAAAPVVEEEVALAPEVGGAQMELFTEKELEPRAITRKTPEAFMRFLNSLKVSKMRKQISDAKKNVEQETEKIKADAKKANEAFEASLNKLAAKTEQQRLDTLAVARELEDNAIVEINKQGLADLQGLVQKLTQELATKTNQYKSIVQKAERAEYYIPDADRKAADEYLSSLREDLDAVRAEIKDAQALLGTGLEQGTIPFDLRKQRAELLKNLKETFDLLPPSEIEKYGEINPKTGKPRSPDTFYRFIESKTLDGKPVKEDASLTEKKQAFRELEKTINERAGTRNLARAVVAVDSRLAFERDLLKKLTSKQERLVAPKQQETEQALARRNIAILESSKRRLADLQAKARKGEEARQLGLGLPGTKLERKNVVIETDEETIELKKKYNQQVANVRSEMSKLKKKIEGAEKGKAEVATAQLTALYGKLEALRQDLAKLQDQPIQQKVVTPITALPESFFEAVETKQISVSKEKSKKALVTRQKQLAAIDRKLKTAKGVESTKLQEERRLFLETTEKLVADKQALELAEKFNEARERAVRPDKNIPRITEEQLAAQLGTYLGDIAVIDEKLKVKGKKAAVGFNRELLISGKETLQETVKEIKSLINASSERIATIIDNSRNTPRGTPLSKTTEAAKLQYQIDAMSYSAPEVKAAAKEHGFKSQEYARALVQARRNAMANMSEMENVPQAHSIRSFFERKGILKSRGAVDNPTTVADIRNVIKQTFPLAKNWYNKITVVANYAELPGSIIDDVPVDTRGFVTPDGDVFLIASNIPKGQELAVLLHELGAHVGFRNMLGEKPYTAMAKQVEAWAARNDGSQESKIAQAAMRRVEYAFVGETPDESMRNDEILAYFVEEAVIAGVNPTGTGKGPVAGFLYRLYQGFIKLINNLLGPDFANSIKGMTAQDFVDFAYGAADFELRGEWHGSGASFREFDHSHISSGEGQQVYMWGTYTSRAKETGESYAYDRLNDKSFDLDGNFRKTVKYKGKTIGEWLDAENDIYGITIDPSFKASSAAYRAKGREQLDEASFAIKMLGSFKDTIKRYPETYSKIIADKNYTELLKDLRSIFKAKLKVDLSLLIDETNDPDIDVQTAAKKDLELLAKATPNDFSFEGLIVPEPPSAYLYRVMSERGQNEYWELEAPLDEQSQHVQNSFDALLNDIADPEDAAMLRKELERHNNRKRAADIFPAYILSKSLTSYSSLGLAKRSKDGKLLAVPVAQDQVPVEELPELQRQYFKEIIRDKDLIPKTSALNIHVAAAELLWSYGIAGNMHKGYKDINYVNFFDKQQQILTTEKIEVGKKMYRPLGAPSKYLFSVNYPKDMPSTVADTVQRITGTEKGFADKLRDTITGANFRARFVDRLDPLENVLKYAKDNDTAVAQQMFEAMYYSRMHDQRMNFTAAVVNHGGMQMVKRPRADGQMEFIPEAGFGVSLREISETLREAGMDADAANRLFTTYMAHQRAKNNRDVGLRKLNFNTDPDKGGITVKMLQEVDAYIDAKPEIKDAFEKARTQYNEYNKNLINFLEATGAVSKDLAQTLNSTKDYIPFYRVDEKKEQVFLSIGTEDVPINIGSLKEQPYLRELVGGNTHIVDFFTSSIQNTSILTDMALRNLASSRVATSLEALQFAKIKPDAKPEGPNVVRFKVNGETHSAVIDEDKLQEIGIDASIFVKGLEGVSMTLPFMARLFTGPAQILRKFVTRNPVYMLRQLVRDTSAAALITGADIVPVYSAVKQLPSMIKGTSNVEDILKKRGVLGGQTITGSPEDMANLIRDLANGGKTLNYQLARLDALSMKADAATRVALYDDFRKKGMSEMEATMGALESMNFGRRGYSPTTYMLSMLVPFMNAQIQGLDVAYRAFTGKMYGQNQLDVRKKLWTRGALLAATAVAYAALMQDDEAYENAAPEDKYTNFFVYIPGVEEPLRIPIPFELGYIFKALPEMLYNMATTDETLQKNMPAIKAMVANSMPVGLPQFIKPALEVAVNYSFYGGRAIESEREMDMTNAMRVRQNTTEISKLLSQMTTVTVGTKEYGLSPIQIDYLFRNYFSGLAPALMSLANPVLEDATTVKPETRASGTILVGGLFQPKDGTGLINFAYEQMRDIEQRQRTLKELERTGTEAAVIAFEEENEPLLDMSKDAGRFKKKMGDLAKEEREIRADPNMTPAEKRKELDEIRQERIALAKALIADVAESKRQVSR